jgi:hypothetical protein
MRHQRRHTFDYFQHPLDVAVSRSMLTMYFWQFDVVNNAIYYDLLEAMAVGSTHQYWMVGP